MFKTLTTAGFILTLIAPAAALAETSVKMDADGDGTVTMSEFTAAMPDAGAETFAEIDTDADGALSEAEITAAVEAGLLSDMSSEG